MSNSTKFLVRLCGFAFVLLGLSSVNAYAQADFYTRPGAPDYNAGTNDCASPAQACELQDAIAQARAYLTGANTQANIWFEAGTYREDTDFDQIVLNSPDLNDVYAFLGYNYTSMSPDDDATITLTGDEYDFTVGNIEQTGTGVNNIAQLLDLVSVSLRLTGEPTINFADDAQVRSFSFGPGSERGEFVINTSEDVDLRIAEPDPTTGDVTPNVMIEVLSVLGSSTTSLGVIDRFGPVNDPQLEITESLTVDNGMLRSRDGVLVFNIDADLLPASDIAVTITSDGEVNFDDILVNITDAGTDDVVIFDQTGTITSNGLIVNSEADLAEFNFTAINGPVEVNLTSGDADIAFTNLTQIGDENETNTFTGVDSQSNEVIFEEAVVVLGDAIFTDADLRLAGDGLDDEFEATEFSQDLTLNDADIFLEVATFTAAPTSRYHNLEVFGDVMVNDDDAMIVSETVNNHVTILGDEDTQLELAFDLTVNYLIVNKEDDGDEVEIEETPAGGNLIIDEFPILGTPGGMLTILEGEFSSNGRLDAEGTAIITLDEGGELDRQAGELAFVSDDPSDLPARIRYTGTAFTRVTGDEIERIDELEAIEIDIVDGELVLDQDITLTEELILTAGELNLIEDDVELSLEIAETGGADLFTIVVNNGRINGTDANIVYPSEFSDDFEVGEDGLVLEFVGSVSGVVGAEFPNARLDEVVELEKTGSAVLSLMRGEQYRVNGDIDIDNGTLDLDGATLEMRGFNDNPELYIDGDANLVDTADEDSMGVLRFIGEGFLEVYVDERPGSSNPAYNLPATEIELTLNDTDTSNDQVYFGGDSDDEDITFRKLTVISADATEGVVFDDYLRDVTVFGDYSQMAGEVLFENNRDLAFNSDVMVSGGELDVENDGENVTIDGSFMQTGGDVDFTGGDVELVTVEGNFSQTAGDFDFFYDVLDVNGVAGVGEADTTGFNFTVTENADFFLGGSSELYVAGDFNFTGESNVNGQNAFDGEIFFDGAATQIVNVSNGTATDQFALNVLEDALFDDVTLAGNGGIRLMSDIAIDEDGSITFLNGVIDTDAGAHGVFILNDDTEDLTTFVGGTFGQRNNPEDDLSNIIRLGSRDSFVDGTVTRRITGDQATGGIVNEGYFFPVGLETDESTFFAPLLLQFGTEGRTTTAQVTTFGRADAEGQNALAAFGPFAVPLAEDDDDGLILNTLGNVFYKVEFDAIPSTDPNIRVIAADLPRGVVNAVRELRIVQLPCADGPQFEPRLAGIYDLTPGDPDDFSFGLNDFINGVPNVVQEGVDLQECQIFAVAANNFRNPIDGSEPAAVAEVQLIHASPDAPEVDIYVNGFLATTVDFLEATPFTMLPLDGEVDVYLAGADTSGTEPVFSTTLDLVEEGTYVLAVAGEAAAGATTIELTVIAKENARTEALNHNMVEFFFMHAAPSAPVVDVLSLDINNDADDVLANNLAYGDVSSYENKQPETYTFAVQTQDGTIVEAVEFGLGDYPGEALAFLIVPIAGGDGIQVVGFDANGNLVNGDVVTDTENPSELPVEFTLDGNYPNPFNPSTSIQFDLPQTAEVTIEVVDMLGRRVMMLPATTMQAGANQQVRLDAQSLSSGTYIYRVIAKSGNETSVATGRMTLIK